MRGLRKIILMTGGQDKDVTMLISEALDNAADWYSNNKWNKDPGGLLFGYRSNGDPIIDCPSREETKDCVSGCALMAIDAANGHLSAGIVSLWVRENFGKGLAYMNDYVWKSKRKTVAGLRELAAKAREQGQ